MFIWRYGCTRLVFVLPCLTLSIALMIYSLFFFCSSSYSVWCGRHYLQRQTFSGVVYKQQTNYKHRIYYTCWTLTAASISTSKHYIFMYCLTNDLHTNIQVQRKHLSHKHQNKYSNLCIDSIIPQFLVRATKKMLRVKVSIHFERRLSNNIKRKNEY